jgi:hypothetical protein
MSRTARLALASTVLLMATGCAKDDPRVADLGVGIPKDSAMGVMGLPATDRGEAYLMNGQYIEAFVVRKPGVEGPRDSLSRRQFTPVVVVDGKVTGWSWKHWDSVAGQNGITIKPE